MEKPGTASTGLFAGSPLARIAGATLLIGALTVIARSTTVAREIAAAGAFGAGDALDAYLIAYAIPIYLLGAVAGSFQSAFVPRYIALTKTGPPGAADQLVGNALAAVALGMAAVSLALIAVADLVMPLMAIGFDPDKLALARGLLYLMAPIIVFGAVPIVYSAWLNALERFRVPALLPGIGPLVAVAALVLYGPAYGIRALAGGTVAGAFVEVIVVALAARMAGVRVPMPRLKMSADLAAVGREFWPLLYGTLLFSSTTLVDQVMTASLAPGSLAVLGFGSRVTALVIAVAGVGVATAVLPTFSRLVADQDWHTLIRTLVQFGGAVFTVAAVISAGIVLLSTPLTEILFERGNFSAADTGRVASVQTYYALQLPFFLLSLVLVRMLSALEMNRTVLGITAFNTVFNIVLNYFLMQRMGVAGIALSTTLVHFVSTLLFATAVARRLGQHRPDV
jgi:putative peptidoglycan lipid II flippase